MTTAFDITAIGNAIVDVIAPVGETFLTEEGLVAGSMSLIDEARAEHLTAVLKDGLQTPGGSAANTVAGVVSLGGRAAYIGKVAEDDLGRAYRAGMESEGVAFHAPPLGAGAATGRSLIAVTPDGERTMNTFLGAAGLLTPEDVAPELIEGAAVVYLEGYLFDPGEARRAFAKAAALAHGAGREIALTLSDAFVVDRHREALMGFIETQADILFANEAEVLSLTGAASFEMAVAALAGKVRLAAITRSAEGSVVLSAAGVVETRAEPVAQVVDTTGAGDQYAAGFLFAHARGFAPAACARLGSLAAAEVISHYGPRPAVSLQDLARNKGLLS